MRSKSYRPSYVFNKFKPYLFAILFLNIFGCVSKRLTKDAKTAFFFQMADTQFGMFTNDSGFVKETINFEKAINSANRLHPAFVAI